MLLTVFSLLTYLALIISAAPGYVQEKRHGFPPYYPGRKNVSPRSVAINSRYSHPIHARNPHGGGHKHRYGPQPILQTATTLINVHPTNGYRKCLPGGKHDDCGPPERHTTSEPPSTMPPMQTEPETEPEPELRMETEPPQPTTTPYPSTTSPTTTTTELNIYQGHNKIVELRARLPAGQAAPTYSTYRPYPPTPPPPPVYQPPPPVYQTEPLPTHPPPPPPPRYAPPPPRYAPPPESSEPPYHRPGETLIRIGAKDEDYEKKKYKVLICKLQKDY